MRNDLKIILVVFLIIGGFIFVRGFQSNLGIFDIITIFATFICFVVGFSLLTTSIADFMIWISNILLKKW